MSERPSPNESGGPEPARRRTLWGRRCVLQGALLLLATFFLPVIKGCNHERVPVEEVVSTLTTEFVHPELEDDYLLSDQKPWPAFRSLAIFFLPFWAGILCLGRFALEDRGRDSAAHGLLHWFLIGIFVCWEMGYMAEFIKVLGGSGPAAFGSEEFAAALAPLPVVALFVGLHQFARTPRRGAIADQFILGLVVAGFLIGYAVRIWIGFFQFEVRPGLFVGVAGGLLVVAGTVLEWLDERVRPGAPH